jgi:hypothetical protein
VLDSNARSTVRVHVQHCETFDVVVSIARHGDGSVRSTGCTSRRSRA